MTDGNPPDGPTTEGPMSDEPTSAAPISPEHDQQIRRAFDDLTARARHGVVADPSPAPSPGPWGGRSRGLILLAAAVLAVVGLGGWAALSGGGGDGTDVATGELDDSDAPDLGAIGSDDGSLVAGGGGVVPLDARDATDVFVVTESPDGLAAGFATSPDGLRTLPTDAVDAAPDGAGGIIYVTTDEVWRLGADDDTATALEQPGIPVHLIGPRTVGGEPVVAVLIGGKVVGYGAAGGRLIVAFEQFSGPVADLDLNGSRAAAVIERPDGAVRVETVSLVSGAHRILTRAVEGGDESAPRTVAVDGDRVLVVDRTTTVRIIDLEGSVTDTLDLPIDPDDVEDGRSSFADDDAPAEVEPVTIDVAGDRALVTFGESVLVNDLATGEYLRDEPVQGPLAQGWVRTASWAEGPSSDPGDPDAGPDLPALATAGVRYRVDTELVAADTSDPFLNVRTGADAGDPLVAKLPPTYRGLRSTGGLQPAADGGTWIEVELLDPVALAGGEPAPGANPTGWVNTGFVVPLVDGVTVGLDEVPGCAGQAGAVGGSGSLGGTPYVYGLDSEMVGDRCLRVVVGFGSGTAPFSWGDVAEGAGPANGLPSISERSSGGQGTVVDLGRTAGAWPGATDTDDGVYIVRDADGTLDLVVPVPVASATITGLRDLGVVVVDLAIAGQPPQNDNGVVLTRDPLVGQGSVSVVGLARPFEANLQVEIVDDDGEPVPARFSGSSFLGTLDTTEYGVGTTDWAEAWGRFAVEARGLEPGDYTMRLNPGGGADDPEVLEVPFTITQGGDRGDADSAESPDGGADNGADTGAGDGEIPTGDEQAAAEAFVRFAQGDGAAGDLPLAAEVTLALGVVEQRTVDAGELGARAAWRTDVDEFAGRVGPFSPLDVVDSDAVRYTAGPVDHCAAPPLDWPAPWDDLRQITIEPVGIDSCLDWYAVSLFLDDDGEIAVVALDLWEP